MKLYHAIKSDGHPTPATDAVCAELGIDRVPVRYDGVEGPRRTPNGVISEAERAEFRGWVAEQVPEDYTGPAVLDYEAPFWDELRAPTIETPRLREILRVYASSLETACRARPTAAWGFAGLPDMRHIEPGWRQNGASIQPIVMLQEAVFPAAYDDSPRSDRTGALRRYVEQVMSAFSSSFGPGLPVYPFINLTFAGQGENILRIGRPRVLSNAMAVAGARFGDARPAGIVVWDSYRLGGWETVEMQDERHASLLRMLGEAITPL